MNLHTLSFPLPKVSGAGGQKRRGQDTSWLRTSRPGTSQWRDRIAGGVGWRQCGAKPKVGEKVQNGG
ncbi:Hypothetical predicted protein [Scomber scombrus]|uniref:Uncharacterized protein n=1 Tax=Scomber scombrus TaxID=13677 RepID=A0AAV1P4E4_SCOSC